MKKENKTTMEQRFDKEFIGGVKSSLGDYIGNKTGRRIKQFISQERIEWERDLREKAKERGFNVKVVWDFNPVKVIRLSDILSLLESKEEKCI